MSCIRAYSLLLLSCVLPLVVPQSVGAQNPTDKKSYQTYDYGLRVTFTNGDPLSNESLAMLLRCDAVFGAALRSAGGDRDAATIPIEGQAVEVMVDSSRDNVTRGIVPYVAFVMPEAQKGMNSKTRNRLYQATADKLMRAIAMRLSEVLNEPARHEFDSINKNRLNNFDRLEHSVADQREKLIQLNQQIVAQQREITDGASQDLGPIELATFQQLREVQIELAGLNGRRAALEQQVQLAKAGRDELTKSDDVVKNLEEVVSLRDKQRVLIDQKVRGLATAGEDVEAITALLKARVELAQAKRAAAAPANARLERAQADLAQIAVDIATGEAKLKLLEDQRSKFAKGSSNLADARMQASIARENLQTMSKHLAEERLAARMAEAFRPTVQVELYGGSEPSEQKSATDQKADIKK